MIYTQSLLSNVKFESEEQILSIKESLQSLFSCEVRARGRHSNRKSVYTKIGKRWVADTQNDIPWRFAETVSFYKVVRHRP